MSKGSDVKTSPDDDDDDDGGGGGGGGGDGDGDGDDDDDDDDDDVVVVDVVVVVVVVVAAAVVVVVVVVVVFFGSSHFGSRPIGGPCFPWAVCLWFLDTFDDQADVKTDKWTFPLWAQVPADACRSGSSCASKTTTTLAW